MRAVATPANMTRLISNKKMNTDLGSPKTVPHFKIAGTPADRLGSHARASAPPLGVLLGSMDAGYLKVDRDYVIRDANSVALKWLEMEPADVIGRPFQAVSPKSPMNMLQNAIEGAIFTDRELPAYRRPDRWMEYHVYPESDGAILFFRDLTERKRLERSAQRTRALLQASLDALTSHIVILDSRGTVIASNLAWQRFAVTHELINEPIADPLNYLALYSEPLARRPEAGRIGEALRSVLTGRRRTARLIFASQLGGRVHWFQLSIARFNCEGEAYLVVANEDVTPMKEAQQALGEAAEQLLVLQEEERQRISEELHDSTMQHLVAIGLNVMTLKTQSTANDAMHGLLREVECSLDEASRELRSFTYLLHPPRLEEAGLRATLRQYLDGFSKRTGLATTFRAGPMLDTLSFALQKSFLRIVQEALANVHRHAAASRVGVDFRCMFGQLHLIISDDGRGIVGPAPPPEETPHMGVGLPGIAARLRQFGGELEIRSGPFGTRLHAVVPLNAAPLRVTA